MKSLLLKDLYNISHNAKSMLFILAMIALIIVPTSGAPTYTISCSILCAMMIMTTFTFDEASGWTAYALILPVTRRAVVRAKYAALAVFCTAGSLFGLAVSALVSLCAVGRMTELNSPLVVLAMLPVGWAVAFAMGSMAIPLAYKYGAEHARVLLFAAFMAPAMLVIAVIGMMAVLEVSLSGAAVTALVCASPLAALAWGYVMYRAACRVFEKKEV